jgi:hypothetical protein
LPVCIGSKVYIVEISRPSRFGKRFAEVAIVKFPNAEPNGGLICTPRIRWSMPLS